MIAAHSNIKVVILGTCALFSQLKHIFTFLPAHFHLFLNNYAASVRLEFYCYLVLFSVSSVDILGGGSSSHLHLLIIAHLHPLTSLFPAVFKLLCAAFIFCQTLFMLIRASDFLSVCFQLQLYVPNVCFYFILLLSVN